MADPIWLDSSTIGQLAAGDPALAAEIKQRSGGGDLLMVPKVNEEVTRGNPFISNGPWTTSPEQAAACKAVITSMNIKLDMSGSEVDRRQLFENQFKFKQKGNSPVVRAIEESDAIVLSQIKASANARSIKSPTFLTLDGRLLRNADARNWNVNLQGRSSNPGGGGTTSGSSGTPSIGTPPGLPDTSTPGYNPNVSNIYLFGLLQLGAILNWLSDIVTQGQIKQDISDLEPWIQKQQQADPYMGILVVVELWQSIPHPDSAYTPAPNYKGIDLVYGQTLAGAQGELRRRWSILPTGVRQILRTAWIAPLRTAPKAKPTDASGRPGWLNRLDLVMNALVTPPDYTEALHILNGSSMYDAVRVIDRLAADQRTVYSLLWDRLDGDVPAFLRTRLEPAFSAASDVRNGTGDFNFYKGRIGGQFSALSAQDQQTIQEYFGEYGKQSTSANAGR